MAALDALEMSSSDESRLELDSHVNMAVIGKHGYILEETGKMVEVNMFTPTDKLIKAPIVDAGFIWL